MEAIGLKLPDMLEEDGLLRLSATWEEYAELSETTPYTIQFLNGEIIMSQATDIHEELVGTLIWLFKNAFANGSGLRVLGSNVRIVVPGYPSDLSADMSIVRGPSDYALTPKGKTTKVRIKNPEIVTEVLSKSTRKFDLEEKLSYYKLIPSLQYILFVDQQRPFASVYARTNVPDEWLNHDYRTLESVVKLGDLELPMQAIYENISFDQ